jgi:hypothetical protein
VEKDGCEVVQEVARLKNISASDMLSSLLSGLGLASAITYWMV